MPGYTFQGCAELQLGPDSGSLTDYTLDFSDFRVILGSVLTETPPTFVDQFIEQKAGSTTGLVVATFAANMGDTSGVWQELWTARESVAKELFFSVKYDEGSVSASNPRFTGWLVVAGLEIGAPAYRRREQTHNWPARAVTRLTA